MCLYYCDLKLPNKTLKIQMKEVEKCLLNDDLGERIKEEKRKCLPRWRMELANATDNLRELHLEYFQATSKLLSGIFICTTQVVYMRCRILFYVIAWLGGQTAKT